MLRAADSVLLERPSVDRLDVAALAEVDFVETTFHAVAEHGPVVASQLAIEQRLRRFVVGGGLSRQRGDRQHVLRRCQRDRLEAVGIGGLGCREEVVIDGNQIGRLGAHEPNLKSLACRCVLKSQQVGHGLHRLIIERLNEVIRFEAIGRRFGIGRHGLEMHAARILGDAERRELIAADVANDRSSPDVLDRLLGSSSNRTRRRFVARQLRCASDLLQLGLLYAEVIHRKVLEAEFDRRGFVVHAVVAGLAVREERIAGQRMSVAAIGRKLQTVGLGGGEEIEVDLAPPLARRHDRRRMRSRPDVASDLVVADAIAFDVIPNMRMEAAADADVVGDSPMKAFSQL